MEKTPDMRPKPRPTTEKVNSLRLNLGQVCVNLNCTLRTIGQNVRVLEHPRFFVLGQFHQHFFGLREQSVNRESKDFLRDYGNDQSYRGFAYAWKKDQYSVSVLP